MDVNGPSYTHILQAPEVSTHRCHRAPPPSKLTVDHDWCTWIPYSNVDQFCQVREIWRPFRSDGNPLIAELGTTAQVVARVHDVLKHLDIFAIDFFPNGDDGAVAGLRVQEESGKICRLVGVTASRPAWPTCHRTNSVPG